MAQSLDKLFKQIEKDSWSIGKTAMMSAANQALELAKQEADKCLERYLKRKPKIYKRKSDSPLKKAVVPKEPKAYKGKDGNTYRIMFAITYDASQFDDVYRSKSWYHKSGDKWKSRFDQDSQFKKDSQANGIPGSEWILDNYLMGVHPGYDRYGNNHGWIDDTSPQETMTKFFEEELPKKAGGLIYKAMHGAIIDFISSNGGGK